VGFLGKKPQTLLIPIYSTTVLYDKLFQEIFTVFFRENIEHVHSLVSLLIEIVQIKDTIVFEH